MIGVVRGLFALCVTIVIAGFAVFNRSDVPIIWNPVDPEMSVAVPVYGVVLGAMLFGFITGALMVWINTSPLRRAKRQQKKEIKSLEKEMSQLKGDGRSESSSVVLVSQ